MVKLSNRENLLFERVCSLIESARLRVVRTVNTTMVLTYYEIGHSIVEYEQGGKARADYAAESLEILS